MINSDPDTSTSFHRSCLPSEMLQPNDGNIMSILKNCLGKELSKVTMPVTLNEPLSFLQRICEYMEYAEILDQAASEEDPADRMKLVATFAVSALASNWERIGKPFNPLLGETYELQRKDFKFLSEQVSHHPPISAFHAESPHYMFYGSINPKIRFMGKSIEIQPKGVVTVEFPRWKEAYTWSNVNCCVHNVVVGKLWIEQHGTMEIRNHSNGYRAHLEFKETNSSKEANQVFGVIENDQKTILYRLYGKWNELLKCTSEEDYQRYIQHKVDKEANTSHDHHSRKILSKLNSFKMSSFLSVSMQDDQIDTTLLESLNLNNDLSQIPADTKSAILWNANVRPENSTKYYHFTDFAMQLNAIDPKVSLNTLCPTDSRLRPDIRCLEEGDVAGASAQKNRLEEKQRDTKRLRKGKHEKELWKPRWFKFGTNPLTQHEDWMFTGAYWDRNYDFTSEIF
ncbi:oxysterol-binding protein-related protein 2 [Anastrepha obliqua]|uniref:oxysterol-binding protein-related protein 2 n=1 Tax=Anastrepha obliqua TaxID=95512 RepID=UPI002409E0EF|nr:oxysterol-binding protein-related protein 2 [Anastrepha obliqua]